MSKRRAEASIAPVAKRSTTQIEQTFQRSIEKALIERICIVGVEHKSEYERVFSMAGTKGDLYHITLALDEVTCDCPHGRQGATCKHILYCLIRKCKVPRNSPLLKNKALTIDEWACLFPPDLTESELVDADAKLREKFERVSQQQLQRERKLEVAESEGKECTETGRLRAVIDAESECSICCCEFEPADETTWCRVQCGTNFHRACLDTWAKHNATCPYCRAEWPTAASSAAFKVAGYINLLE